eukprot:jgi/Antlo1/1125/826
MRKVSVQYCAINTGSESVLAAAIAQEEWMSNSVKDADTIKVTVQDTNDTKNNSTRSDTVFLQA